MFGVGLWSRFVRNEPLTPAFTTEPVPVSTPPSPVIDTGTLYGVRTIDEVVEFGARRVTRAEAMRIPAVKLGRDLICRAGAMPLQMLDTSNAVRPWPLLSQPEDGVSALTTWSQVIEDLILYPAAWLYVVNLRWSGHPATVLRLDPASVSVPKVSKQVRTATGSGSTMVYDPDPGLIRIDSPSDGLLTAGADAIRALGRLNRAALMAAEGLPPQDWFTPVEGNDPDDEAVQDLLDSWLTARQKRTTGWVPGVVEYHQSTYDAEKAQLADARQQGVLEVARLLGVDPEDLGVSTTSRTYANQQDRRRDRIDFAMGQYTAAIEARLSMDDVTPVGCTVRFDTSRLSSANDLTAAQTDAALITAGIKTRDEIRGERGLEPLGVQPAPPVPALPAASQTEEVA